MIEAEYKEKTKNLLSALGVIGAASEAVIENKAQECEMRAICCGFSIEEAFDIDIKEGRNADED